MPYRTLEERSILVVGQSGTLIGLDRESGKVRWEYQLERFSVDMVTVIAGDLVLASGNEARLFCVRYSTGTPLWYEDTSAEGRATIMVDGDQILVAKGGHIDCFTLDGKPAWKRDLSKHGAVPASLGLPGNIQQGDR